MTAKIAVSLSVLCGILLGCVTNSTEQTQTSSVFRVREVSVGFPSGGWQFFWGTEGELGMPIDAFVDLYAERAGKTVKIKRPSAMRRIEGIQINTTNDALSFVRIFTDKIRFARFDAPAAIEYPDGNATVEQTQSGYVIRRRLLYLAAVDGKDIPLREVEESVSTNGGYRCRVVKQLPPLHERPAGLPMIE